MAKFKDFRDGIKSLLPYQLNVTRCTSNSSFFQQIKASAQLQKAYSNNQQSQFNLGNKVTFTADLLDGEVVIRDFFGRFVQSEKIVNNEGRLYKMMLTMLSEDHVDDLACPHGRVYFDSQFFSHLP